MGRGVDLAWHAGRSSSCDTDGQTDRETEGQPSVTDVPTHPPEALAAVGHGLAEEGDGLPQGPQRGHHLSCCHSRAVQSRRGIRGGGLGWGEVDFMIQLS